MLLTIDVGNTETKLGVFDDGFDTLRRKWRVTTDLHRTPDEYGVFFTQLFAADGIAVAEVDAIAVASVVPKLDPVLEAVCTHFFRVTPQFLKPERQQLLPVVTDRPAEVGADLVAAAIGARARFGAPLIVVSYGTATVFTAISAAGEYLGAAIAPGIAISIDALVGRTAKLPQIALDAPAVAIGRNTVDALHSGIIYGFVGQTEAIVARMRAELGQAVKVVATGGLAEIIAAQTDVIDAVDPHASLEGLRLFHEATSRSI
jgi:type III pantothenate kinase